MTPHVKAALGAAGYAASVLGLAAQAPPAAQMLADHWILLALLVGGAAGLLFWLVFAWRAYTGLLTTIDERVSRGVASALAVHISEEERRLDAISAQLGLVLQHLGEPTPSRGSVPVLPNWDRTSHPGHRP